MATQVLYPQDVLPSRRLWPAPFADSAAASFARRRQAPGPNPNPNPRLHRRPEPGKRREGSPRPKNSTGGGGAVGNSNLVMGQVTILSRGESLDSDKSKTRVERRRRRHGSEAAAGVVRSLDAGGDLMVFGTGRLGPEPAAVPGHVRVTDAGAKAGRAETYAGSAFSQSPSPRALPLPTFSSRKAVEGGRGAVDLSATRDLRRLLGLD